MTSISLNPIAPWPLLILAALAVTGLTIWAYQARLRGTKGRWRWFALGLRLMAVLLCVLAALRPSIVLQEKKSQPSSVVFLIDDSTSMKVNDEVRSQTRWGLALKTLAQARKQAEGLGPNLDVKAWRFDSELHDQRPDAVSEPEGRETALGSALVEAVRRQAGKRIAALVVLSDAANNSGVPPLVAARRLRSQQVPVVTVGFGSENAGAGSRDIAVRDLVAGPTVFVKNQLQVRGVLVVRGFANQTLDVEMLVEGHAEPVATQQVKVPEGSEVVPVNGLKYIPQTPGEKKVTLRVKPKDGELLRSNNEVSTFITALAGGLNVLYLQGATPTWEYKYLYKAIEASPDIEVDLQRLAGEKPELTDELFATGRYNVYILGDLPANHLSAQQQRMLTVAVEKGAGLIMLGGRSSFGAGGWASSELARVLPIHIHPGDGQVEPEGGLKFIPNTIGLDSYIFQVGTDRADSARIWTALPPVTGSNRFGEPKLSAQVLAEDPNHLPLMIGMDIGLGRTLAFGGETWVWARNSDDGRMAHRKFWRQVIFWLAHREDQGESQVKLALERRRVAVGQKLEMTATARDSKNNPITNVTYETTVEREIDPSEPPVDSKEPPLVPMEGKGANPSKPGAPVRPTAESIQLLPQGDEGRGAYFATGQPGTYRATVTARVQGNIVGRDTSRFLVYQDDREMENPAADRALLRQIAEITGGESLPPEQLPRYLKQSIDGKLTSDYFSQTEHRIWDNWPFFLIFTTLLMLEWWLRKRHGWV